ncbi:MAG: hypothetical protein ACE5J5_04000 [Candidatus Hydrothermarchaeales archaeon]
MIITDWNRGADEPETRFFRCTKCKFTWRDMIKLCHYKWG